jgi:hypothetical protein
MHRWFDIAAAKKDLKYEPIVSYREGWTETIEWFRDNWLPKFRKDSSFFGIADQSQVKIDIQEASRQRDLKAKVTFLSVLLIITACEQSPPSFSFFSSQAH